MDLRSQLANFVRLEKFDQETDEAFNEHAPLVTRLLGIQEASLKVDGMAVTSLESHEAWQDEGAGPATFRIRSLPLPITWKETDKHHDERACLCAIARETERAVFGLDDDIVGILNHPRRTEVSFRYENVGVHRHWTCRNLIDAMIAKAYYGPYLFLTNPADPVVPRMENWEAVQSRCIPPRKLAIVQTTPDVVRMVSGLRPGVYQLDEKVLAAAILVPQIRPDCCGSLGIIIVNLI